MPRLTIENFGNDLDLGPPENMARLVVFDLAEERAKQGFRYPKLIELSIADRFIRAIRANGVEAAILERDSATAEGTGDFVYEIGPKKTHHRFEVVRHVDGARLAAEAARQRAVARLKREYPECVARFAGYDLRLSDDMPDAVLRSVLKDVAVGLADFAEIATKVRPNVRRSRRWRHCSGATIFASVVRVVGRGAVAWHKQPTAFTAEVYDSRFARTVKKKLAMYYDRPQSASFELLIWTTNEFVLNLEEPAALRTIEVLQTASYQPFDSVWLLTPMGSDSDHLLRLWPLP